MDSAKQAFDAGISVSDARLSSFLDTAVDGILVINERGEILVYNRACEMLFGYVPAEALGQTVHLIMPADYASAHNRYMSNYMDTGVRKIIGIGREVRARHKDGTEFPVELSVGEARTPDGRQFIGIIRDLRSRKEAERRVNELQADLVHIARVSAMDEMGAALAHELNQPLTAIMLYLQAATRTLARAEQAGEPPSVKAFKPVLEKAVHEAERVGNIINRMRHFVEKREPHRRECDLNGLITEACELILLGQRNPPRIRQALDVDLPRPVVDPVQIQQILINLLRNAVEVLRERPDPIITISTERAGDMARITIADNGPGMPPEMLSTLFKAFSTSKRTGMGLGLSISRTIAQNHSGDLTVDPGGGGKGATFMLHLPIGVPGTTDREAG